MKDKLIGGRGGKHQPAILKDIIVIVHSQNLIISYLNDPGGDGVTNTGRVGPLGEAEEVRGGPEGAAGVQQTDERGEETEGGGGRNQIREKIPGAAGEN